MAKLRRDEYADIDFAEMDEAEYSDADFSAYDGEVPDTGTILDFYGKKMWWSRTANVKPEDQAKYPNGKPMIKILLEASGNEDGLAEYDGLPIWHNFILTPKDKFTWGPAFEVFGLESADIKNIELGEPDNQGSPILRIKRPASRGGAFEPGGEDSWCRIVVKRGFNQNGDERAEVKKWLPYDDEEEDLDDQAEEVDDDLDEDLEDDQDLEDDDTEDDEDLDDEDDQDLDDELEDEEDDTEPEPAPARGRRTRATAAKPAPARSAPARSARKAPAAAQEPAKARSGARTGKATAPAREPATARRTARSAAPARGSRTAGTTTAARGGKRRTAKSDDPPF